MWAQQGKMEMRMAILFLVTYVFLLRLPSEALEMRFGPEGLQLINEELTLVLPRRCASPWPREGASLLHVCV